MTGGVSARVGVPVQLAVDAAQAGEGNLEITVAARGLNIPTQVHPQVTSQIDQIDCKSTHEEKKSLNNL